jgi:hypothetical protein
MRLIKRFAVAAVALAATGAAAFWLLTAPKGLTAEQAVALGAGDVRRGERIFNAGGCTSCHARPKSEGAARLELAGGLPLVTAFGTFVAPNISPRRCSTAFRRGAAITIRPSRIRPMRA